MVRSKRLSSDGIERKTERSLTCMSLCSARCFNAQPRVLALVSKPCILNVRFSWIK